MGDARAAAYRQARGRGRPGTGGAGRRRGGARAAAEPDATEIAGLAGTAAEQAGQAPWSIRVRHEPSAAIRAIADQHGLTTVSRQPFMLLPRLGNLTTLPAFRRRGYGRAVAEAILRDGRAAGAHTAYLHSTDVAVSLFERAGFRTAEHWSMLSAF